MPAMTPRFVSALRLYPLRLLRMPALRPLVRRDDRSTLAIEGLVCGLCAARVRAALAAVPGVDEARVSLSDGVVELRHGGQSRPDADTLRRALDSVVVGRGARRALAMLARRLGRATGAHR